MSVLNRQLPEIYLQPGEVYLAHEPTILRTLLGSCIGVTFWNPRVGVGALCHGLLPRCPPREIATLDEEAGCRYVDFSIRHLAKRFDQLGAIREEVQVKLFGGADVLPIGAMAARRPTVGKLNCEAALEVLQSEGFGVVAASIGGTLGRNIQFDTETGEVLLRWLNSMVTDEI